MGGSWRGAAIVVAVSTLLPPSAACASNSGGTGIGAFGRDGSGCVRSADAVDRFLRSVERGELAVFGHVLTTDQLRPVRVEYAYELESGSRTVSVHARLVAAMPLPADATMVVRSVAAVMGCSGQIVQTQAHVTRK